MPRLSILRLRARLVWVRVFLWIASAGRSVEVKPEVHLYLADVHFRLASEYDSIGRRMKARRHRAIANRHAELGPPPDLPPAVAVAMAVPREPIFTDARGTRFDPPDGVA